MSKLKFSFLVLMLMVSVSASADWAPADVQAALKKMYPTADDVAWSHDESYYVADFLMNGFDTKVWFDGQAQWVMQVGTKQGLIYYTQILFGDIINRIF